MSDKDNGTLFSQRFDKLNEDGKRYVLTVLQSLEFAQEVMFKHQCKPTENKRHDEREGQPSN